MISIMIVAIAVVIGQCNVQAEHTNTIREYIYLIEKMNKLLMDERSILFNEIELLTKQVGFYEEVLKNDES